MTDCVFVVAGSAPTAVFSALSVVLASRGLRPTPGSDAARASFSDERGQHATVGVELRRDRFGSIVSAAGLPSPEVAQLVLRELNGVLAPPPIGRPRAVAPPAPAAPVAPAPLDDDDLPDDHTRPRHAKRSTTPSYALRLVDGRSLPLRGRMLLGRDPVAPAGDDDVAVVPVADPERALSKTHLAIEVRGDRVLIQDLGSTNGTHLEAADGSRRGLQPRHPIELSVGDVVLFGLLRATLVEKS